MIVISTDAYLAIDESQLNSPLIGYNSLVTPSNITTNFNAAGFPASNMANPATFLYWKAISGGNDYIQIDLTGNTELIDYVAIGKHNWFTAGKSVTVFGDTGAGLVTIVPAFVVDSDSPLIIRFEEDAYIEIQVYTSTTAIQAQAAVCYCGKLLTLPRNIYVGHKPITINSMSDSVAGYSESGNFLGRIIVNESRSTTIQMQNLTAAWVRNYLVPFLQDAKTRPFFFAWRPETYSDEVGFVWFKADPMPDNQRSNGMMQFTAEVMGIV